MNIETIRYYEREAFWQSCLAGAAGYRLYAEEYRSTCYSCAGLRNLGFFLDEVRALLHLAGGRRPPIRSDLTAINGVLTGAVIESGTLRGHSAQELCPPDRSKAACAGTPFAPGTAKLMLPTSQRALA